MSTDERENSKRARALIDHVFARAGFEVPGEHIAAVLLVLDSHYLLRGYDGTPEEYHERVTRAYGEALRKMVGGDE